MVGCSWHGWSSGVHHGAVPSYSRAMSQTASYTATQTSGKGCKRQSVRGSGVLALAL